jgi:hypothetical protein
MTCIRIGSNLATAQSMGVKSLQHLLKVFILLVLCLVVYHLVVGWLWHMIGFEWEFNHWRLFGWATYVVRGVAFPIVFAKVVFHRLRENEVSKWWKRGAYWICLLPLMASAVVDSYVFMVASGYQAAEHDWGAGVEGLIVLFQWAITAFLLKAAFNSFDPDKQRDTSEFTAD